MRHAASGVTSAMPRYRWVAATLGLMLAIGLATPLVSHAKNGTATTKPEKPATTSTATQDCATNVVCQQVSTTANGVRIVGTQPTAPEVADLLGKVSSLLAASNRHDIEGVVSHFSPGFISGDNLALRDLRQLIEETWKLYPDIHYDLQAVEIRINGNWATIETVDSATATAKPEPPAKDESSDAPQLLPAEQGTLRTQSRGMLYLHRVGRSWEITSDRSLYETAAILYGNAKHIPINLSAPDQVFANEPYTARIEADVPDGTVAIASITRNAIQYPPFATEDRFRSVTTQHSQLERVFAANANSQNELITAVVGLTEVGQDTDNRPTVTFKGMATLTKRVNVSPQLSPSVKAAQIEPIVKFSASGATDFRDETPSRKGSLSGGLATP